MRDFSWVGVCAAGWRAAVCCLVMFFAAAATAEDWPQFRGRNGVGVSTEARKLPAEFSATNNVAWVAEPGEGIASPVISHGRVFTTAMTGKETFAVLAYDSRTGSLLWKREFETGELPPITPPNTPASSTPACDGERVFVYFSTLGLMGLDATQGDLLWKHAVPEPVYLLDWGAAHSPIVHDGVIYFNQDDDLSPHLVALDARTGEQKWRVERSDMLAGYSLPVFCTAGGRTDLVIAGTGKLKGYDPVTGVERWTCNTLVRTIMTSPAVVDDMIYVSVESFGDTERVLKFALLQWKDANQDGKLTKSEIGKPFWEKFDAGDVDKNGELTGEEIDQAFQSPDNMVGGGKIIQAIRGGGDGDVTKTHVVWRHDNHKAPSNIASPLVVDGRVFLVKRGGISSCLDAASGETVWAQQRLKNLGNYYASPIAADGKIFVTGENGIIVVIDQGPALKILSQNDMGESCIATPAVADGRLYVRTLKKLFCVALPE